MDVAQRRAAPRDFGRLLSLIVVSPTFIASLVFVYLFIFLTVVFSLSRSKMVPAPNMFDPATWNPLDWWVGLDNYLRLWNQERWHVAIGNLAIFGLCFIAVCLVIGLLLAILLDQRIRAEGTLRTVYLYPMALSFIVSGTAWRWLLNPTVGIQQFVRDLGFPDFVFAWTTDADLAVYALVLAGVWQSSGFVMALFLAALRGVDQEIIKAAYLDGASLPRIYLGIVIPSLRPVFLTAVVVLAHIAVKSFDLVVALTGGGPGYASDLPANFMYEMTFRRNQIGTGGAAAVMMLMTVMAIIVPYLYSELRGKRSA